MVFGNHFINHLENNYWYDKFYFIQRNCKILYNFNVYVRRKRRSASFLEWSLWVSSLNRNPYSIHVQNRDDLFWLQNRIQRKISRWLMCNDNRFMVILPFFSLRFVSMNARSITKRRYVSFFKRTRYVFWSRDWTVQFKLSP